MATPPKRGGKRPATSSSRSSTSGSKNAKAKSGATTKPAKAKPPKPPKPPARPSTPPADIGATTRVTRLFQAPASAVFSAFNDPTRRAWSPEPMYRVLSALAPRFVRLALPDGSQVAAGITRQGNTRCSVSVDISGLADQSAAMKATVRWRNGLEALAEQLDLDWD